MTRAIVHTKPVSGAKPAIRVEFQKKALNDYFSLRRIAVEDFGMSQTSLARMILCDWIRKYRTETEQGKALAQKVLQSSMNFEVKAVEPKQKKRVKK